MEKGGRRGQKWGGGIANDFNLQLWNLVGVSEAKGGVGREEEWRRSQNEL